MAHKIGYARVSTTDQDPQLQLDALAAEDCLKIYTDTATGTKADRSEWNRCLADLRPGDTLIIWKIDRLGRNLRDLIEIVTALEARGVGVKSLTNGIIDTTTAHGKLVFGIFALMAEYEAALIQERTMAGLAAGPGPRPHRRPQAQDDTRADRQSPAHVRRRHLHHGRDRRLLRRHPHDGLPEHPRPARWPASQPYPLISGPYYPDPLVTRSLPGSSPNTQRRTAAVTVWALTAIAVRCNDALGR